MAAVADNQSSTPPVTEGAKAAPSTMEWPSAAEITDAISEARVSKTYAYAEDHAIAEVFRGRDRAVSNSAWGLLAQIFNFHFRPGDAVAPFGPMWVMDNKRSMIPADLTNDQLDGLAATLTQIEDPEYRARLGDVLWLRRKDAQAARIAIESYLESGQRLEDPDHWVACIARYERAIRLARSLGNKEPLLNKALEHLLSRVKHYDGDDKLWLTHRALSLLYEFGHGDPLEMAAIAAKVASKAKLDGDFRRAAEHHDLEAKFFKRAGNVQKTDDALRAIAERHADDAEAREAGGSYMVAHKFWNDAIQAYRRVPNSSERIKELHRRLNIAGDKMRAEMKSVGTEIDLSAPAKRAQEVMEGRALEEALCLLVAFVRLIDPTQLRTESEQMIKDHPLQAMIQADIFDAAGRKVDVRPSALTDDPAEYDRAVRGFMDWHAGLHRFEIVQGTLVPAMQKILETHSLDHQALEPLIKDSGFIPPGRLPIFVRAIRLGFERDFSTSLHLLIPQVENSLRHILAKSGVITTTLDAVGIEETWPLGRILSEPQLVPILGEPLVYELRSLLLGQPGSNYRNLLAHGLLGDNGLNSHSAFYLWWLILRLVIWVTPQFQAFAGQKQTDD
jgi:hypothetical protein